MAEAARGWQWALGATLVVLLGVLFYLFTAGGGAGWGDPLDELPENRRGAPSDGPAGIRADGEEPPMPIERRDPNEPPIEPAASVDREQLAHLLFDGGWGPPEAGLGPPEPSVDVVSEAAARSFDHLPGPPTQVVLHQEATPQTALRRAVFWRDLLDSRIDALRAEAEAANVAGDEARRRRAARMIERLEAQRPALGQRIGELEAAAEAAGPEEPAEAPPAP